MYNQNKKSRNHGFLKKKTFHNRSSFENVAYMWIKTNKIKHKGATENKYTYLIEKHILPEFGNENINNISAGMINNFSERKIQCGRLDKSGGLSPSYVRTMVIIINSILKYAAEEGLCSPLKKSVYKPQPTVKKLRILTRDEQLRLENFINDNISLSNLGILLSLYTGLRIGEVCALNWNEVDLNEKVLHIKSTATRIKNPDPHAKSKTIIIIERPKTASSVRDIPIPSKLIPILKQYHMQEDKFFLTGSDNLLSPRTYEYRFHKTLSSAQIKSINYHALRHTFATRCIECGVDIKTLSEFLGHSDVSTTLRTYVHTSMELKRIQIEKLNNCFE